MASSSDRGPLAAVVIAFVVLAIITAARSSSSTLTRLAELSVSKVDLFAPHTQFDASQRVGARCSARPHSLRTTCMSFRTSTSPTSCGCRSSSSAGPQPSRFADGSTQDATVVPAQQLPRLGQIFPQLASLATEQPFRDGDEIAPGTTSSGSFILLFPNMTQDQWNKKRSAVLTVQLRNQDGTDGQAAVEAARDDKEQGLHPKMQPFCFCSVLLREPKSVQEHSSVCSDSR